MALNLGLTQLASNLDLNLGIIILILAGFGCMIFYAKGFTFGVVMTFFGMALTFMLTYGINITYDSTINYIPSLVLVFFFLILMAFSIYFEKSETVGGLI